MQNAINNLQVDAAKSTIYRLHFLDKNDFAFSRQILWEGVRVISCLKFDKLVHQNQFERAVNYERILLGLCFRQKALHRCCYDFFRWLLC